MRIVNPGRGWRRVLAGVSMNVGCCVPRCLAAGSMALMVFTSFADRLCGVSVDWRHVSPYRVCDYVNRASRPQLAALWADLGVPDGDFLCSDSAPCSAVTQVLRPKAGSIQYVVVRVRQNDFDPPFRYLLYSRGTPGDRWRLHGNVDFDFADTDTCYAPIPAIQRLGGKECLVFRYPRICRCTGCSVTAEQWLEIGDLRLSRFLTINTEGRDFACSDSDPGWEWKQKVLGIERIEHEETLKTIFTIFFFKECGGGVPFSKVTAHATFAREVGTEFTLQANLSDPGYKELLTLTASPSIERNGILLKYAIASLEKAARGSDPRMRQWLFRFLSRCADSPEKAALERLLIGPPE
jgi:hypothetical protein